MNRAVVVGFDGSPAATAALLWAAEDAGRRQRPLRIVHVREPWAGEHPLNGVGTLTERCDALLENAAARARAAVPEVTVSTALVTGAVLPRLLSEAETADTLLVGSRGLGGVTSMVLGSVGLGLAGRTGCPLVVVRAFRAATGGDVVVGDDGSSHAQAALEYALEQASSRKTRVRVIYAVPFPALAPHPAGYGPLPVQDADGARNSLAPWKERYPQVEIVESEIHRHPVPALAEASRTAGLVVVGSRGLTGLTSAVLGSVSHAVLHRSRCPVAVLAGPRS
ncbi:universal stress protein [Nonomuraea monospora]|uniref:Universal stress protein n=1 Tax=Nonomuraea monospora TaxID=568818 RepID=A0ABN3D2Y3_9ACTN